MKMISAAAWGDPFAGTSQVKMYSQTRASELPGSGEGFRVSRTELIPKKIGDGR